MVAITIIGVLVILALAGLILAIMTDEIRFAFLAVVFTCLLIGFFSGLIVHTHF